MINQSLIYKLALIASASIHVIVLNISSEHGLLKNNVTTFSPQHTSVRISLLQNETSHSNIDYKPKATSKTNPLKKLYKKTNTNKYKNHKKSSKQAKQAKTSGRMGSETNMKGNNYNLWLDKIRKKIEHNSSLQHKNIAKINSVTIIFKINERGHVDNIKYQNFLPLNHKKLIQSIINKCEPFHLPKDKSLINKKIKITFVNHR